MATIRLSHIRNVQGGEDGGAEVGGQAVLGRQLVKATPWLTERHGYDPTLAASRR